MFVAVISAITISSIFLVFPVVWHGFYDTNEGKRDLKHSKGLKASRNRKHLKTIYVETPICMCFLARKISNLVPNLPLDPRLLPSSRDCSRR